ncbi:hypothetical protein B296_00008090 [Ensete ventricosum]|uniref:Uncharacterized protein n=1 Tax=Ensete ventricosum TaxID=4639 RepID=A0A427AJR9_ENSVE|nr:hypothetical protein B296_00008090 [Ensete ventricosum]
MARAAVVAREGACLLLERESYLRSRGSKGCSRLKERAAVAVVTDEGCDLGEEEGLANDSSRCVKDGRRRGATVAVAMTRVVARAAGSGQRGNSCCGNDKGYSEGRQ